MGRKDVTHPLLRRLYHECNGWVERMHEKLVEEEKIEVGYSTLTRMVRKFDWAAPGRLAAIACPMNRAEMQHDTTV